ncbi:MAG: hypothetical protein QRY72_02395 [Candidatus Rhabdochlamydia sp.]
MIALKDFSHLPKPYQQYVYAVITSYSYSADKKFLQNDFEAFFIQMFQQKTGVSLEENAYSWLAFLSTAHVSYTSMCSVEMLLKHTFDQAVQKAPEALIQAAEKVNASKAPFYPRWQKFYHIQLPYYGAYFFKASMTKIGAVALYFLAIHRSFNAICSSLIRIFPALKQKSELLSQLSNIVGYSALACVILYGMKTVYENGSPQQKARKKKPQPQTLFSFKLPLSLYWAGIQSQKLGESLDRHFCVKYKSYLAISSVKARSVWNNVIKNYANCASQDY